MFQRNVVREILNDIVNDKMLIRAIFGPRQVGKTTAALQIVKELNRPYIFESADSALPHSADWISTHWLRARALAKSAPSVLVLDEIQKIYGWSEEVKQLWDEDRRNNCPLSVLILGSSALLLQEGLTESLSGRFFSYQFTHWNLAEMQKIFSWSLDEWLYFGGYPGAASFRNEEEKWKKYINDSLIETVLARDVLQSSKIKKPALLRQLFGLSTTYPAHILSYNKMLGQLQDAGNTTTLAEYLRILGSAFLVKGLELFSKGSKRKRGSSPKIILLNNALINAPSIDTYDNIMNTPSKRGWLVENAVGAHLYSSLSQTKWSMTYWRQGNHEIDFVLQNQGKVFGIEVKSGRLGKLSGTQAFRKKYPAAQILIVGSGGIPLEEFFLAQPEKWFV